MADKNLWGDLKSIEDIKTPAAYLVEQANLLSKETENLLVGVVETQKWGLGFRSDLIVEVPYMNNYRYSLLLVEYPLAMYSLKVYDLINKMNYKCDSQEQFIDSLRQILSSPAVHKVLATLKAQNFSST